MHGIQFLQPSPCNNQTTQGELPRSHSRFYLCFNFVHYSFSFSAESSSTLTGGGGDDDDDDDDEEEGVMVLEFRSSNALAKASIKSGRFDAKKSLICA